jgi:hypothetical protein
MGTWDLKEILEMMAMMVNLAWTGWVGSEDEMVCLVSLVHQEYMVSSVTQNTR